MYARSHIHTCSCCWTHTHIHALTWVPTCTHILYVHTYICMQNVYTHTCIHKSHAHIIYCTTVYMHTFIHTYERTYMKVYSWSCTTERTLSVWRLVLIRESCSVWSQIILIGWIGVHVEYTKTMIEVSSLPVCILPAAIKRRTWPPLMYFRSLNSSKPPN